MYKGPMHQSQAAELSMMPRNSSGSQSEYHVEAQSELMVIDHTKNSARCCGSTKVTREFLAAHHDRETEHATPILWLTSNSRLHVATRVHRGLLLIPPLQHASSAAFVSDCAAVEHRKLSPFRLLVKPVQASSRMLTCKVRIVDITSEAA